MSWRQAIPGLSSAFVFKGGVVPGLLSVSLLMAFPGFQPFALPLFTH